MLRDQFGASLEWPIAEPAPADGALSEDPWLSPDAALIVLDELLERYDGLSEWADAAKEAAVTRTAVEVAQRTEASKTALNALREAGAKQFGMEHR
jgi:hypothetical protein